MPNWTAQLTLSRYESTIPDEAAVSPSVRGVFAVWSFQCSIVKPPEALFKSVLSVIKGLLFYVVTICPSAVHPVGYYYFTNSNSYQSSIPSEWNVDAECPWRYSKIFVYYNFVFTSTEKSNFVAIWNLVGGGTCITGKTVTILSTFYFYKHSSLKINSVNFQFMRFWIRIQIQVAFYISDRIYWNKTWLHFFNIYN